MDTLPAWTKHTTDAEIMYYFSVVVSDIVANRPDKLDRAPENEGEGSIQPFMIALAATEWFIDKVGHKDQEDYWGEHGNFWGYIDHCTDWVREFLLNHDWESLEVRENWPESLPRS